MIRFEPALPPGYRLLSHDSVGSTNDEAKKLARDGAAGRTLVWALEQTAGRGRHGRIWESPRGNLYVSLILRPDCPLSQAVQLGFVAAVAVGDALGEILPPLAGLSFKWPNDVLLHGRKVAGILLESEMTALDKPAFVVVGVGVNLNSSPRHTEFPATSIAQEVPGGVAPAAMLEKLFGQFHSWEKCWQEHGFAPVRAAWRAAAPSSGEPIRVRLGAAFLHGRFLDIDEQGSLLLECAGEQRCIASGEVFPVSR